MTWVNKTLADIYMKKYYPMKDMQFKVHSPEHSKAIQERLFELGYEWGSCGKMIEKYPLDWGLYATNRGVILRVVHVPIRNYPEATLDDLYKMEKEEPLYICGHAVTFVKNYPTAPGSRSGIVINHMFFSQKDILKIANRLNNDD